MYREHYLSSNSALESKWQRNNSEWHTKRVMEATSPMTQIFRSGQGSKKRYNSQSRAIRQNAKKELMEQRKYFTRFF